MKNLLKKDIVQRAFYVLGLIVLILLSFKDGIEILKQESSLGIKYWYFFIIPCCILIYQIVFNNKIGWTGVVLLYCAYVVWFVVEAIKGVKEKLGYFETGDYLTLLIIFIILISFGFLLYKIKPLKRK